MQQTEFKSDQALERSRKHMSKIDDTSPMDQIDLPKTWKLATACNFMFSFQWIKRNSNRIKYWWIKYWLMKVFDWCDMDQIDLFKTWKPVVVYQFLCCLQCSKRNSNPIRRWRSRKHMSKIDDTSSMNQRLLFKNWKSGSSCNFKCWVQFRKRNSIWIMCWWVHLILQLVTSIAITQLISSSIAIEQQL